MSQQEGRVVVGGGGGESSIRSPEFQEWDLEHRRPSSNTSHAAGVASPGLAAARCTTETPELRTLEVATKIMSSEQSVKSIREGFLNVIRQASGMAVDPGEAERILELISGQVYNSNPNCPRGRGGGPGHVRGTSSPDDARHTIEQELRETARMAPRHVDQRSRHCDPTTVARDVSGGPPALAQPLPGRGAGGGTGPAAASSGGGGGGQAPCTFSSTKSDRSLRSDTKKPKPRVGFGKERKMLPADLIRQLPGASSSSATSGAKKPAATLVQSASSAFSQRSDGSINAASDEGRVRCAVYARSATAD